MRQALALAAALAVLGATGVLAGDAPRASDGPIAGDGIEEIAPAEWKRMVLGHTVTYRIGGRLWAHEAYATTGNAVEIQLFDGTCMEGVWEWADGAYCFYWSGGEDSCFRHVRADGEILVIPVGDGMPGGTIQTVAGISDLPLTCGPALSS